MIEPPLFDFRNGASANPPLGLKDPTESPDNAASQEKRLIVLHRHDDSSRLLFPLFVDRCLSFIVRHQTETDPDWLTQLLYAHFQAGSDDSLMIAALDQEGKLIAHLIAKVEVYAKESVGYVLQVEKDKGRKGQEIMEKGFLLLKDWAKKKKLTALYNLALNEQAMRLWRRYGFKVTRYLMRAPLEGD